MFKTSLVGGLLALMLFGYAQHHGWSMFSGLSQTAQPVRSGTGHGVGGGHVYHK